MVAEIAMVGMLAMRFKPGVNSFSTIEWDSEALKVQGEPDGRRRRTPPHAAEVAVKSSKRKTRRVATIDGSRGGFNPRTKNPRRSLLA